MPILKTDPSQLAIHGGGPAAFETRVPVISAHAGDGKRFADLAERMFACAVPGELAEEFERCLQKWIGVRNVIGFASSRAATRALVASVRGDRWLSPALGHGGFPIDTEPIDCEPESFSMDASALVLREDASGVFAAHELGRPCRVVELEDACAEWDIPLILLGPQALGCQLDGERLGRFGRAEIFQLGRDQLVHALDAAIVSSDDDLLAHRLRVQRQVKLDGIDPSMGDAAAAMGMANLESAEAFISANQRQSRAYLEGLQDVPGIRFLAHPEGATGQGATIQIDPNLSGLTRNSLQEILAAENVGVARPFEFSAPAAARLASSLLQLPSGPAASLEVIQAVCRLVSLAITRSLESPDPLRLAA